MAPPGNRRPGFSRRAQYGLFLGYVIAVAGILFALMLLVIAIIDPRGFNALKGAGLDATVPVASAGRSVVGLFTGSAETVGNYWDAAEQNKQLKADLAAARRELIAARVIRYENQRLHNLLRIAGTGDDRVTVARVVGSSLDSPRRFATLSAGASDGIRVGMPVRAPDGLIGRVLDVGRWASRVLMVTDGDSNVPVLLVRSGTAALAVGRGDGFIDLRTLEVGANPFRPGDVLVTSGVGGIYPPGVPVARVIRIEGDSAVAVPAADPARADFALVTRPAQAAAASGNLNDAPQPGAVPPPPAGPPPQLPPTAPQTPAPRQRDPNYQPALQQPQPGVQVRQPAPAPAQAQPGQSQRPQPQRPPQQAQPR